MVTYFLNQMGPWHIDWYKQQGLTETVVKPASKIYATYNNVLEGTMVEVEEVTTYIAGGRIDIRDDSKPGYDGWDEYSVDLMEQRSWNAFGEFLDELTSKEPLTLDELIYEFEHSQEHKIKWYKDTYEG
ncbi:MAG: hypothetical protein P8I94_03675 [Emcibacteraceae bacterium]|nr:hypothetical protein [Emcibacteraceae bacterium]